MVGNGPERFGPATPSTHAGRCPLLGIRLLPLLLLCRACARGAYRLMPSIAMHPSAGGELDLCQACLLYSSERRKVPSTQMSRRLDLSREGYRAQPLSLAIEKLRTGGSPPADTTRGAVCMPAGAADWLRGAGQGQVYFGNTDSCPCFRLTHVYARATAKSGSKL